MVPKKHQQGVRVLITTYRTDLDTFDNKMDLENKKTNTNKFICSICLNAKDRICNKEVCTSCQNRYNTNNIDIDDTNKREEIKLIEKPNKGKSNVENHNTKAFTTQETDLSLGLNLLNEVLTVFKNKKQNIQRYGSLKTLTYKDVSTSTDNNNNCNTKSNLVLSKVFLCSIEGTKDDGNCKCAVVNSSQPDYFKKEYIIDLKKHKSSSIPQMRIDELKNSLKEKTKSKDVNEEVNRIFATVNMNCIPKNSDHSNRPVIRKGPRVLPVVKTKTNQDITLKRSCKCCQTSEYYLSSGDSFVKPNVDQKKCQKYNCISCCQYQRNNRRTQTSVVVCQNCHNTTEKFCNCHKSF